MRSFSKFVVSILLAVLVLVSVPASAVNDGFGTVYTYNYDHYDGVKYSPDAYYVSTVINSTSLGLDKAVSRPQSIYVRDGVIYLADTGNNRIVVIEKQNGVYTCTRIIDRVYGSETETLKAPQDVFVAENGNIYIADTDNNRVILADSSMNCISEFLRPGDDIFNQDQYFLPQRIVADRAGRVYVLAGNVSKGLLKYEPDGTFVGYIGANEVTTSAAEYIWKYYFLTEEQQEKSKAFVPTEYANIAMDSQGFIYAVTNVFADTELLSGAAQPVRRINGLGSNILVANDKYPPVGDIVWDENYGPSRFYDVTVLDNDIYVAFDRNRGRLFGYDSQGIMLWAFGTKGNTDGAFTGAVSIEHSGYTLLCLDQNKCSITVFEPTEYGRLIYTAYEQYEDGDYEGAADTWTKVGKLNSNYIPTYIGIGRSLLRQDRYSEAMEYFEQAYDKENYAVAFKYYRKEWVENNIGWLVAGIIAAIIALKCAVRSIGKLFAALDARTAKGGGGYCKKTLDSVRYAFYVIRHPFDGFWDLVHEKKGSISAAVIFLALFTYVYVARIIYTGFQFTDNDIQNLNIFQRCATLLLPFFIICAGNWSMTTLFDGKGRFSDIFMAMCYAFVPYIIIQLLMIPLSHILTYEETALYFVADAFSVVWTVGLIFIGLMQVHDYGPGKTLLFIGITILAACVIIFLMLVIFSLLNDMMNYLISLYKEYIYRMN